MRLIACTAALEIPPDCAKALRKRTAGPATYRKGTHHAPGISRFHRPWQCDGLAVGIIIGAAFTAIVNSLVEDLINPIIGFFTGGVDFSNLFFALSTKTFPSVAEAAGVAVFRYGSFITSVINFLIIAWVVFVLVRTINRLKTSVVREAAKEEEAKGPTQEELLTEIRDALRAR